MVFVIATSSWLGLVARQAAASTRVLNQAAHQALQAERLAVRLTTTIGKDTRTVEYVANGSQRVETIEGQPSHTAAITLGDMEFGWYRTSTPPWGEFPAAAIGGTKANWLAAVAPVRALLNATHVKCGHTVCTATVEPVQVS